MTTQLPGYLATNALYHAYAQDQQLAGIFDGIPASEFNGLHLVPRNTSLTLPILSQLSEYWVDMVLGHAEYHPLAAAIVNDWAVTGEAFLVGGQPIRSDYITPVINGVPNRPAIGVNPDGYVVRFPARPGVSNIYAIDNTGDILTGQYEDNGFALGRRINDAPPMATGPVIWLRDRGFYPRVLPLLRAAIIRYNMLQLRLNVEDIPVFQIDSVLLAPDGNAITPSVVSKNLNTALGLVVQPPFFGNEGAKYIVPAEGSRLSLDMYLELLYQIAAAARVPANVLGLSKRQDAIGASARVNRILRWLNAMLGLSINLAVDPAIPRQQEPSEETSLRGNA